MYRRRIHETTLRNLAEAAATFERTDPSDYGEAIGRAMTHWPDYSDLYGMEPCNMLLRQAVSPDASSAHLPARRTFTRTPKDGPMSRALAASGALIADAREFRTCGMNGGLETPLTGPF